MHGVHRDLYRPRCGGIYRKEAEEVKYIEDGRSLVERNHDAREYCYQCRREREARMNRIVRRCLVVSSMIFMCSLLVGWAL